MSEEKSVTVNFKVKEKHVKVILALGFAIMASALAFGVLFSLVYLFGNDQIFGAAYVIGLLVGSVPFGALVWMKIAALIGATSA